jgi:hypothetical protein
MAFLYLACQLHSVARHRITSTAEFGVAAALGVPVIRWFTTGDRAFPAAAAGVCNKPPTSVAAALFLLPKTELLKRSFPQQ